MKALIQDIIDRFGPRPSAGEQEYKAQQYFAGILNSFCDTVEQQEFKTPHQAMFGGLKLFYGLFYISLTLYWFSLPAAFILSLVNTILFLGHFVTYQYWLDPLFPKKRSSNVIGDIEPGGEAKSTLIVSGHMDSAHEFIWWYWLGQVGVTLTVMSGFVLSLFPLFVGIGWAVGGAAHYGWWFFAVAAPITVTKFFIHGNNAVPGAQDNLSGVTVAHAVGQHFAQKRLKHTRIRVISFGSEEIGLKGSRAYARQYADVLKQENAVHLNLDGIKDFKHLNIVQTEPMLLATYPNWLVHRMGSTFEKMGVQYGLGSIPFGGTDAVSLHRAGVPALSIIGLNLKKLDPTYHTRRDIPKYVQEKALTTTRDVLIRFAEKWDEEQPLGN